ncbi:MAG: hypothetical protein LIP12_06975 [Clostridiales bacterium]|nr:hypothetical protein [Clostridiales bacterium]
MMKNHVCPVWFTGSNFEKIVTGKVSADYRSVFSTGNLFFHYLPPNYLTLLPNDNRITEKHEGGDPKGSEYGTGKTQTQKTQVGICVCIQIDSYSCPRNSDF